MAIINTQIKGGGGVQPVGTLGINTNGVYDVSSYANADVQVPTTAPDYYVKLAKTGGLSAQLYIAHDNPMINMAGIRDITDYALARAYYSNNTLNNVDWSSVKSIFTYGCAECFYYSNIKTINLNSLTTIATYGLYGGFYGSTLQSISLPSLTSIQERGLMNAFGSSDITSFSMPAFVNTSFVYGTCYRICANCNNLTTVDLSSLETISNQYGFYGAFSFCRNLTTVELSSLTTISGEGACNLMFDTCSSLTSMDLSSLTTASGSNCCNQMFSNCTSLQSVDLSGLQTVGPSSCANMFKNCSSLRTVDLSNIQSYGTNAFSGTFDGCTSLERVILSDALTKRNPTNILDNVPVQTCEYADRLEYITNSVTGLCRGNKFATANMKNFELVNISAIYMFANNTNLTNVKFPVLTRWNTSSGAGYIFQNCTNANFTHLYFPMLCVFRNTVPFTITSFPSQLTIHFRKDQQTIIMNTTGSSSAFGGNALLFDLIGTITVNGTNYIYQAKENETGYKAWQKASSNITVNGVVYTFAIEEMTRNTAPVITGDILYGWKNGSTTIYTNSLKPQVGDYIWARFDVSQSTTPITAVDNEYVYTVDNGEGGAEPAVGDTVYSDIQGTVLGTIDAVA